MVQAFKNAVLHAAVERFSCDIEDTIVVAGSPRSGTTWLAELLLELPGYKMLDEPLNLNSSPLAQQIHNLNWRTYVPEDTSQPEIREALETVLTGTLGVPHMWRFQSSSSAGRLLEVITCRKLVVKAIRINRMLPWFSKRFPVRTIVSTFRHPCAVVASQIRFRESWRHKSPPSSQRDIEETLGGQLPNDIKQRFSSTLRNLNTTEQTLAAMWCLDTYMALDNPVYRPQVITTYEALVGQTEREMAHILNQLGEEMSDRIRGRFEIPSNSAADDLRMDDTEAQLSKWRRRLDKSQIQSVLRVVEGFGLDDIYSESLYPNTQALCARVEKARERESRFDSDM